MILEHAQYIDIVIADIGMYQILIDCYDLLYIQHCIYAWLRLVGNVLDSLRYLDSLVVAMLASY